MTRGIETRLRKLEDATSPASRLVVVRGHTDAEHEARIAELQASGAATAHDTFVCIRLFGEPAPQEGCRP
jgi:hypothetical protein